MITLGSNSCVYISCPSSFATGGTELLHQLGFKLKKMGIPVKMYYYDYIFTEKKESPVCDRFRKYDIDFTLELKDNEGSLFIIPEIALYLVNKLKKSKAVIWWLSVDSYLSTRKRYSDFRYKKLAVKNFILGRFDVAMAYSSMNTFNPFSSKETGLSHWVQSEFAKDFLIRNGIHHKNIACLSDYLNEDFIKNNDFTTNIAERADRVLYNPLKGIESTLKIRNAGSHLEFVPLQNLSPIEVAKLLQTSKVYIDFGNHPGKDRIPREAAISGAVVITNRKGSAAFKKDVPIDDQYKIEETDGFEIKVLNMIEDIFVNFEKHYNQFDDYRNMIRNEEKKFDEDLTHLIEFRKP